MLTKYAFREDWLNALTECFRETFFVGSDAVPLLPGKIRSSCGFPKSGRKAIGECWSSSCSKDKTSEIFIHPKEYESLRVADILLHECIHAAVGNECGHTGAFRRAALALGLEGPMTATTAGDELKARLARMIETVGDYPHAELVQRYQLKKEGTRMLKLACPGCGMIIRTTRQWLDNVGAPTCACGCGKPFEEADA